MQLLGKIFFWFSMRWLKDLCPGMLSVMSTCTADLRRNSVSGLNLPSASWTMCHCLHNVPSVSPLFPWEQCSRCYGTAALVAELFFGCLCSASCVHGGQSWLSLELVHLLLVASGHWVQLYLLSKDGSFLRHVRKDHPDRKSVTCCFSLR